MARSERHGIRSSGRVVDFLRDGKKTVLASALVIVMAIMWIRVLIGHKPGSAAAAVDGNQVAPVGPKEPPRAKIKPVALPRVPGRNDAILRDCFRIQDGAFLQPSGGAPSTGTGTEVQVVSPHRDQEVVQQVAQTLKLEAVVRSGSPCAFVNDRMLRIGDRFTIESGADPFEFEVLRIFENAVLVECRGIQLTLKLAQVVEVRK